MDPPPSPFQLSDSGWLRRMLACVSGDGLRLLAISRRRRAWGYVLAPVMLVAMVFLAVGIVSLMAVLAARGLEAASAVGPAIAVLAVVELVVVARFLGAAEPDADLRSVLRPSGESW